MRPILIVITLCFPAICQGAVSISEIAWMGSSLSANHEWIELHNSGNEAVNVDGWTLTDSNTLAISLSGNIASGAYAVLERTSDDSASGAAFLIYTGALVNTGTTLTLRDAGGAIIDQVVGGENWSNIGGDNVNKYTAQYNGSQWITALATPGSANASVGVEPSNDSYQSSGSSSRPGQGSTILRASEETARLELKEDMLSLTLDVPDIVYVQQAVSMEAVPSGLSSDTIANSLVYVWNFGDLSGGGGREVVHRYAYPGEYVISVHAQYAKYEQVARKTLRVLPVTFSITRNSSGDIQINNNAPYEVILDGYTVRGDSVIEIPPRTVLLPRATITIPRARLVKSMLTPVSLVDGMGQVVATETNLDESAPRVVSAVTTQTAVSPELSSVEQSTFSFLGETHVSTTTSATPELDEIDVDERDQEQELAEEGPLRRRENVPFFALLLVLIVGIGGVYWSGRNR